VAQYIWNWLGIPRREFRAAAAIRRERNFRTHEKEPCIVHDCGGATTPTDMLCPEHREEYDEWRTQRI